MSLNLETAIGSLRRIVSLLHLNDDDARAYALTIVEAVGWMQPIRFEEVCKKLVTEMNTNRRPVPAQYIAVYRKLEERNGWKSAPQKKCQGCNGEYWVPTWVWHEQFNRAYTAVNPCPLCSSYRDLTMMDGIREITKQEFEEWREQEITANKAKALGLVLSSASKIGVATTAPAIETDEEPPPEE